MQEIVLDVPELLGQINIVLMRILESLDRIPERIEFLGTVGAELLDRRAVIDEFAVIEDPYQELSCRIVFERLRLPCLDRIENV